MSTHSAGVDADPPSRSRRAAALPPEERRAAIVAAALPLLLERGLNVTTRQVAEAAGVAEGTLFRVFPDKGALVDAVVDAALDTSAVERAIAAIPESLAFEQRLAAAVEILKRRHLEVWRLLSALDDVRILRRRKGHPPADLASLAGLFGAEAAHLRLEPVAAARLLRSLTLATTHPSLNPSGPMAAEEIVAVLLDGIRARPAVPPPAPPAPSPSEATTSRGGAPRDPGAVTPC